MSENRKAFTFIWKIKNIHLRKYEHTYSPLFFVHVLGGTKWKLGLRPNSGNFNFPRCVACYIRREHNDSGPVQLELDYELSYLSGDGSVLHSEVFQRRLFERGYIDWASALHVKAYDVFHKKDLFMTDYDLTIRCRMWNSEDSISLSERCFAETSFKTQCMSFVGTLENFSCLVQRGKYPLRIISSTKNFLSSMDLSSEVDGKLALEIKLVNQSSKISYKYKVFIRDIFEIRVKCGQGEFLVYIPDTFENRVKYLRGEFPKIEPHIIPFNFSKDYLMENKSFYLPSDVLTIECEITFPIGEMMQNIEELEYAFDCEDTQEMISNEKKTDFTLKEQHIFDCHHTEDVTSNTRSTNVASEEHHAKNVSTLKDDLNSLFKDGILCDTKLKTATETFPAHLAVLSARSSVFRSMFTTEMKEKTNKCVEIDDLEADTVRQMLSFMYTDTLDNLEYESAKNLYFAADKYDVVSLRYKCSYFLNKNIQLKNCCEILALADQHQDEDLKTAVQDFIAENDEAVLFSDEWKNLEKNHPQLTLHTFRAVYMKNRRSKDSA